MGMFVNSVFFDQQYNMLNFCMFYMFFLCKKSFIGICGEPSYKFMLLIYVNNTVLFQLINVCVIDFSSY